MAARTVARSHPVLGPGMSANGNGKSRIHLLGHQPPDKPETDAHGRALHRTATVKTVYEIVAEETAKVHEFYMQQIPQFTARMIQDALMSYGLITLSPEAQLAATPAEAPPAEPARETADAPPPVVELTTDGGENDP